MQKPKFLEVAASFVVLGLALFLVLGCTQSWKTAHKASPEPTAKKKFADSRHVVV